MGRACFILGLVIFVLIVIAAGYGYWKYQFAGIVSALVAGGICGLFSVAALVVTGWFAGGPKALAGTLGGTGLRTGGPMVMLLILRGTSSGLEKAGVAPMILGMFLVLLLVETILAVRLSKVGSGLKTKAVQQRMN